MDRNQASDRTINAETGWPIIFQRPFSFSNSLCKTFKISLAKVFGKRWKV